MYPATVVLCRDKLTKNKAFTLKKILSRTTLSVTQSLHDLKPR